MKTCPIIWSNKARLDLLLIKKHISYDKPDSALLFIRRLKAKTERLKKFPQSGRIVPELSRQDIREILIDNYRIIYKITAKYVCVLTVFEGHQIF